MFSGVNFNFVPQTVQSIHARIGQTELGKKMARMTAFLLCLQEMPEGAVFREKWHNFRIMVVNNLWISAATLFVLDRKGLLRGCSGKVDTFMILVSMTMIVWSARLT